MVSKQDKIWPFNDRRLAIQTTVFSAWIITFRFQWLEFHVKIHGMDGKQCALSAQKAGKRPSFSETLAGIIT